MNENVEKNESVVQNKTDELIRITKEFSKLISEHGTGTVAASLGLAIVAISIADQFSINHLEPIEFAAMIICGTGLIIIGAFIRIYAKKTSIESAIKESEINSKERLEEIKIGFQKEIDIKKIDSKKEIRIKEIDLEKDKHQLLTRAIERKESKVVKPDERFD